MAQDQHLLWTTKGQKTVATRDYFDPCSMYNFFHVGTVLRGQQGKLRQRIKSAAPRLGDHVHGSETRDSFLRSLVGSHASIRNPSPTPATSRPLSSKSGTSSLSLRSGQRTGPSSGSSPTALYLASHRTRCKSAPARSFVCQVPEGSKTGKSRKGSAWGPRSAPAKRAWQNRTSSAKSQHSFLPREEVDKRSKERCKSAPLPRDFASIEVICSVPEQGSSDIQRMKAFTRPLNCMPAVVQGVLSYSGLRHCCSAYQPRTKSVCCSVGNLVIKRSFKIFPFLLLLQYVD